MDSFFATVKPPAHFQASLDAVESFITRNGNRRIVLVTSGGTTVPLERQMVRFLDNFSAGTRGAISAEWFLRRGWAVVFLHRQYSLQPFARHYRHADELMLDLFEMPSKGQLIVKETFREQIAGDVRDNHRYRNEEGTLLSIHFYTVADYLHLLQRTSQLFNQLGRNAMIFLAAAVSDFYLPEDQLSDHKIQSDEGTLTLKLEPVPKVIKPMVCNWCSSAFIISFKLETDPELLLPKARAALEKYHHDVVVANLLAERRTKVTVVRPDDRSDIVIQRDGEGEIEELIVDQLVYLFEHRDPNDHL